MDLTYREIVEILKIVEASDFAEVTIEDGSFRLSITREAPPRDPPAPERLTSATDHHVVAAVASNEVSRRITLGGIEHTSRQPTALANISGTAVAITAPMIGILYRSPAPEQPPFVEVGQTVAMGDTLFLIESMKMFMPVVASVAGVLLAIAIDNGTLVEFGQSIAWIEPAETPGTHP